MYLPAQHVLHPFRNTAETTAAASTNLRTAALQSSLRLLTRQNEDLAERNMMLVRAIWDMEKEKAATLQTMTEMEAVIAKQKEVITVYTHVVGATGALYISNSSSPQIATFAVPAGPFRG